jgi:hypothetical protein
MWCSQDSQQVKDMFARAVDILVGNAGSLQGVEMLVTED